MMRPAALRAALSRRLQALAPMRAHPWVRRAWRVGLWGFGLVYVGFIVLVLALRYSILPNVEQYRPDIERLATQAVGQQVRIERIEARWEGLHPDLALIGVRISDRDARPVLNFSRVDAVLSWWSVPTLSLQLRLLRIEEPTLSLRRDAQGRLFVAGMAVSSEQSDSGAIDWVLAQRRIRIQGATLIWEDELRKAPPLILEDLNLALDNNGRQHRFGLTALPPEAFASRIDLRGELYGASIDDVVSWDGRVFAEVDYVDLAAWQPWIDYPIALPRGRGAMRAWLTLDEGRLQSITTDVALKAVRLQLAKTVPTIELERMSGRIAAKFSKTGFEVKGRGIELSGHPLSRKSVAANSLTIAPTDFLVQWQADPDGEEVSGSATASLIDIDALAGLAAYIPFDAGTRSLLSDYAPSGRISKLKARWQGGRERLKSYALSAGFDDLALNAQGYFPGFKGISGVFDLNERGGSASVRAQASSIDLPSVFPEPRIALDTLNAEVRWKRDQEAIDVELKKIEFAGPDAAGSAQGNYRNTGDGPGVIDLTAALTRGDARAVWRYMPHVVGQGARHWLRDSLVAGRASEAKLALKGDLKHFPFLDKQQGQFWVTVKAQDVTLDYAKGWPQITGIEGDLRFEGNGMLVEARHGQILGATLGATRAEIPDFDAPLSTITIKGQADGPTAEFLKFIDQSPVAERIDHFTEEMRANGSGHLDLDLFIPLDSAHLNESRVNGTYRLTNNEVLIDPSLPMLQQVGGTLTFANNDLQVPGIEANFLGGPLKIAGGAQKDGQVLIAVNGNLNLAQLRKQMKAPGLDQLSGAASYRGQVRINKRNTDLVLDSNLVGIASTLPEPFAKSATTPLPVRFEKKRLPGTPVRDQINASLGNVLAAQIIRRKQAAGFAVERGNIAVGQALQLPESGLRFSVAAGQLDLDRWRRLLAPTAAAADSASEGGVLDGVDLKVGELVALGRKFNDVDLSANLHAAQWKINLRSKQAAGTLHWDAAGQGKLTARLSQLVADPVGPAGSADFVEVIESLPALDVVVDEFEVGAKRFGQLELQASNEAGRLWRLNKVTMSSPSGTFSGKGEWQASDGRSRSQFDFKLEASDVGKLLDRLGYPGTIRGGTAQLAGKVGWAGAPAALDYASLNGDLVLEAGKGQFLKLDPGAGGKLLGLISLQGLPRRITLDFRDVFSDGFAFDSVESRFNIYNGVMRTDRLQIDGPAARVVMRGEVDLKRETQRLNVNVQPELGGTAALGIALVNPIAGVATWVAHKALQNPLNHMFGFDYLVTGSWSDPKVEKLSSGEPAPAAPRLPNFSNAPGLTPPGASAAPNALNAPNVPNVPNALNAPSLTAPASSPALPTLSNPSSSPGAPDEPTPK